jgi:hypothetical protein
MKKNLITLVLYTSIAACLHAQTIDDGVMIKKDNLFAGSSYSHDSWDQYWQGTLKRLNGNLGTVTTQTNLFSGNFGITDRLNVIGMMPYVRTEASQGVLRGISGFQDLTLAAKYALIDTRVKMGSVRIITVVAGAFPVTDYESDFLPLSIGNHSKRISARGTLNFHANRGWYLNGSSAYTWRSDVTLDRPYYFTDGQLHLTNVVDMPGVFDYVLSGGYFKHGVMTTLSLAQQRTQGGGDVRRQDMPFISHRMNFSKLGAMAMVPIPKLRNLAFQFGYNYVLEGRNVGRASTFSTGLMYTLKFHERSPRQ